MNWIVKADFPTPALNRSNIINSKYESWCEPPPPTTTSLYCLKNWAYDQGQPVFRHEDMASRHTLAVGVADISTVCIRRGMGKGGKREVGDSELKLRRSWRYQVLKIYSGNSTKYASCSGKLCQFGSAPVEIHQRVVEWEWNNCWLIQHFFVICYDGQQRFDSGFCAFPDSLNPCSGYNTDIGITSSN